MYRNKLAKGFRSPLIVQPSTNVEEVENVSTNQQKAPDDSTKKPFRTTSQILSLFKKAVQEKDNVEVENITINKQDASGPVDEKKTSTVTLESKV